MDFFGGQLVCWWETATAAIRRDTRFENLSVMTKEFSKIIDGDGENDDSSNKDALPIGVDAEEQQTVAQDFENDGADDRPKNGPFATGQIRATDHRGGDDRQLLADPQICGDTG